MKYFCYVLMVAMCFLGACAASVHQDQAAMPDAGHFDGTWDVTYVCDGERGGDKYTMRFKAYVKNSVFHGKYESKSNTGAFLILDGKIKADGSALLRADGDIGRDRKYAAGSYQRNTAYNYNIDATFTASQGTGKRLSGRNCDLTAVKQ